jgi:DNA-binding NtrC family response regulator
MAVHTHTVLVVDDDEPIRKIVGLWVERLGYCLRAAESAEAALRLLETEDIDVVISDVRMPGADGIWLADRIHELFPRVPVVLATGLGGVDRSITLRPGVVAYVVKPFSREEMSFAIQTGVAWRATQMSRPDQFFVIVESPPPG